MFIAGIVLLKTEGTSAFIALICLGALAFIPGAYYCR